MSKIGHGMDSLNKEFLESNDFTSLEHPPQPKETPTPCLHREILHNGRYATDVRKKSLKNKPVNSSYNEQKHILQQKSVPNSSSCSLDEKSSDHGEEIKFRNSFDGDDECIVYSSSAPAPSLIRRNSSLFEEFKKDCYQNLHMFDEPE